MPPELLRALTITCRNMMCGYTAPFHSVCPKCRTEVLPRSSDASDVALALTSLPSGMVGGDFFEPPDG